MLANNLVLEPRRVYYIPPDIIKLLNFQTTVNKLIAFILLN